MKKFSSISKNNNITNIAIGKFDSMHLAHQAVFKHLNSNGIILFIKMPLSKGGSILPYNKREKYAKNKMYYIEFDKIKDISGKKFIKYLIKKLPNLKTIIVGQDFKFGKNRNYSTNDIPKLANLNVISIPEILLDKIPLHSSYIRNFILNGKVELANKLLGRFYCIEGKVIKGQGVGGKELFPTINIKADEYILPQDGVYATYTKINDNIFNSISFLGNRLSTNMSFAIESHIINKNIKKIPKTIEIFFIKKIRDNKMFDKLESLKKQIEIDIEKSLKIIKNSDIILAY